jgi:hypothetical protein
LLAIILFSLVPQAPLTPVSGVSYSATENAEQSDTPPEFVNESMTANGSLDVTVTRIIATVFASSLPVATIQKPLIQTKHPVVDRNRFHIGDPSLRIRPIRLFILV